MAKGKIGMRDETLWKRTMKAELAALARRTRCRHEWEHQAVSEAHQRSIAWCPKCGTLQYDYSRRGSGQTYYGYRYPSNERRDDGKG